MQWTMATERGIPGYSVEVGSGIGFVVGGSVSLDLERLFEQPRQCLRGPETVTVSPRLFGGAEGLSVFLRASSELLLS
ncbi:MAG: hypothetical protein ACOCVJ_01205 [Verrucomicrobiota bacterium]